MENRISWTEYFLKMAETAALRSPCLSNKKGCVIVKNNRLLSTGYNGPPSGIPHCEWRDDNGKYLIHSHMKSPPSENALKQAGYFGIFPNYTCPRHRMGLKSGEGLEFCPAVHAEANAIVMAGENLKDAVMYCSFQGMPCRECAKLIINAGINYIILNGEPVVYPQPGLSGKELLEMAHIGVRNGRAN
jgi:dCMP deaminase